MAISCLIRDFQVVVVSTESEICVCFFFLLSITKLILHFPFLTWPVKNGKNCNRPNYTVTSTTNIRLIFRDYKEKLRRNASAGTQHERLCNYLRLLTHSISSSILFYSLALKLRVSATKFFVRIDKYNFYDSFRVLLFVSNVKKSVCFAQISDSVAQFGPLIAHCFAHFNIELL